MRRYWEDTGALFPAEGTVTPTSRDPHLGLLERAGVMKHLPPQASVLEVGCGDGAHSVHYARAVASLVALDFSQPLLDLARERAREMSRANMTFVAASVLELSEQFDPGEFDAVISQRCLINLPTWEDQKRALSHIHGVLRPGGRLILSEGFSEELDHLNNVRIALGLASIDPVAYNQFFSRPKFERFVAKLFRVGAIEHYGSYLVLSRVYHPLAVSPDEPKHDSKFNGIARLLAEQLDGDDLCRFSYDSLYALEKR